MEDRKRVRFIKAVLLVIVIVCLVPVVQSCCLSVRHERQVRELRALREESNADAQKEGGGETETGKENRIADTEKESQVSEKWRELYSENRDLIGWLTVEGTKIDYPVMQCEDDEYYLHHNFQREEDKYGCLYVKHVADVDTPGTNVIIYGHHMKDDSMFGDLDKYESESFCREHGNILFETLREERIYEIMAAFYADVSETEDDRGFRYYQFYQADTEEEFREFYENVQKLSIYDTGVTAEYGDTFLTLSTCSSYTENGRFVVVAKRIEA